MRNYGTISDLKNGVRYCAEAALLPHVAPLPIYIKTYRKHPHKAKYDSFMAKMPTIRVSNKLNASRDDWLKYLKA